MSASTPMMQQWQDLKAQAGEAYLFFRLGDFYELFDQDAIKGAPVMGVTLTSRNHKNTTGPAIPLCGIPVANLELYLNKLLKQPCEVALAEQVEEVKPGKTLVRREIVQWFSPGIRFLENEREPHYAAVLQGKENRWQLAAADVSTGHVVLERGSSLEALQDIVDRLPIEDLRFPLDFELADFRIPFSKRRPLLSENESKEKIINAFSLPSWEDSPCDSLGQSQALGTLFDLLEKSHPKHRFQFLRPQTEPDVIWMNSSSRKHLHLFEPVEQSLFRYLNEAKTAFGRRELRHIMANPVQNPDEIHCRQELVRRFKTESYVLKHFRKELSHMQDLHRLLRIRRGPYQLFQISKSLASGLEASKALQKLKHPWVETFLSQSEALRTLCQELQESLQFSEQHETGWIVDGISDELDELRSSQKNANKLLNDLEVKLRKETEVSSLKVKFHQVFGYIAEVTATHKSKIPEKAKRIQTLANAERFKLPELEELESKLLSLETRIREAEKAEIEKRYNQVERHQNEILDWTKQLARLDCFQALAEVSRTNRWTRPKTLSPEKPQRLSLEEAVHPLTQESFVPLSFELSESGTQLMLLSGPNMAGKSTLLRVAALCAFLHQIGSDVPAANAEISIFDRIMCRMGAMDDLSQGKSTFFIEMREVAQMLSGATKRSLLLFDELGRGTSTYDGMSLAWAITEELHERAGLSMVATHYLELSELAHRLSRLKNFHLGVKEHEGKLVFTRKLEEGPASQSYGIQVARLADVPTRILTRAESKLREFETKRAQRKPVLELVQP